MGGVCLIYNLCGQPEVLCRVRNVAQPSLLHRLNYVDRNPLGLQVQVMHLVRSRMDLKETHLTECAVECNMMKFVFPGTSHCTVRYGKWYSLLFFTESCPYKTAFHFTYQILTCVPRAERPSILFLVISCVVFPCVCVCVTVVMNGNSWTLSEVIRHPNQSRMKV